MPSSSLLAATAAQAQGRRASLSEDLAKKLEQGDTSTTSVILGRTQAQGLAVAARQELRVTKLLATGVVVDVPAGRLAALADDPGVDALSSDQNVKSSMDVSNAAIGADLLHTAGAVATNLGAITGKGVGVAVLDTGVANLPQFARRVLLRKDFTGENNPLDQHGHGTLIAGIIAAAAAGANDSTTGVAPDAHIISLKVLDKNGAGKASAVIQAIDYAISVKDAYNIKVINLSLGGPAAAVPQGRPAVPGREARLRGRHRGGCSRGQPWEARRRPARGRPDRQPRQLALRHHRGRREHQGHALPQRRHDGHLQLDRPHRSTTWS